MQEWFDYFQNLFTLNLQDNTEEQNEEYVLLESEKCLNDPFTESEVRQTIRKLKTGKSQSPDGLSAEFFKVCIDFLVPILTFPFNKTFDSGIFPQSWAESIICPVHKKGSKDDPDNYGGISLINIFSKIFTIVLNPRLFKWCEENILAEAQAGSRRGYSTIDNMFTLQSIAWK